MKSAIFLFGLFFLTGSITISQNLEWATIIGGAGYNNGVSVVTDSSGNVYSTGLFSGIVDFDPGPNIYNLTSTGEWDIFILKYDALGSLMWVKSLGGIPNETVSSITLDNNGNIYVTGDFWETVDFNPGSGTFNLTSSGLNDGFILKLDASGNFVYAKSISGTDYSCSKTICTDNLGNIYISGYYMGTADFDMGLGIYNLTSVGSFDIFILKLDPGGNFIWAKSMGGNSWDEVRSLKVDVSSNVYTTGSFMFTADFDPGLAVYNLTSSGSQNIFVSKLDASGNFIWAKSTGGDVTKVNCIAIDDSCNVYTTGYFRGIVDFDPGPGNYNLLTTDSIYYVFISKLNSSGDFVFAKSIGGTTVNSKGNVIGVDNSGNIYTIGSFGECVDFDPGLGNFYITPIGANDLFILKLDSSGNFIYAKSVCGSGYMAGLSLEVDMKGSIFIIGAICCGTFDFDSGTGTNYLTSTNWYNDIFVLKLNQRGASGCVFNDLNDNGIKDINEIGLQNRYLTINPGNIIAQTNISGIWSVDSLPVGVYSILYDTSGFWTPTCPVAQLLNVTNINEITNVPDFGLNSTQPCASPSVTINMPVIRPCFSNQVIYVGACNQTNATGALNNTYVDVELDSLIIPQSASIVYSSLGNNVYRFQLGNLNPGQCLNFTINCDIDCNATTGQTICIQANIFPVDTCAFDTFPTPYPGNFTPCALPWDYSSLNVEGYCQNDSIFFIVTNNGIPGGGDMDCFSPVRIYIDGLWTILDSIQLIGGDTSMFVFPGDGRTWRLEADQHPLHPGNSHPNITIEACGDSSNWTSGLVNILPSDDADAFVDIYCGVVTGSFDPNDKIGYPTGVTSEHNISPNQPLQYVINFQNTGTDTAVNVIIRDTLDLNLELFSVVPGVASSNFTFHIHGPRVLEWNFYNIMLPDSGHNQAGSHGFVTFTVNQNNNLPNYSKIYNSADIYFDYNAPVITNQTMHTVNDGIQTVLEVKPVSTIAEDEILVYPNPASSELFIKTQSKLSCNHYTISDMYGRRLVSGKLSDKRTIVSVQNLANGIYILEIDGEKKHSFKVIKK